MMKLDGYCWSCRKPDPTIALRPFGGYADEPRSSCEGCFTDATSDGRYWRFRFQGYRKQGDGWEILPDWYGRLPAASFADPVELRAIELASLRGEPTFIMPARASSGWVAHLNGDDFPTDIEAQAGWLARQIVMGDE